MIRVRPSVVTTEKPVASIEAACIAASAMPSTGPRASSRAASRPGSPKQAMTWPSTPSASPARTSASRPGRLIASSWWPSIEAWPAGEVAATISVPGPAAAIVAVMPAVVFGLVTLIRIGDSDRALAGVGAAADAAGAEEEDGREGGGDHQEGDAGGQRAQGVDDGRGGVGLHRLQLERQRVEGAHGLRAAGQLVVGEGEAEEGDADERRQDDRQDDEADGLDRRGAEVARRLLVAAVEAVEDGEHDQHAEGQRPGEMRPEARVPPGALEVQQLEQRADAERDHDRGHDQAGDDEVEQQPRAAEAAAEGEA